MVLISIKEQGYNVVLDAISKAECAELRLDFNNLSPANITEVFKLEKSLIATCRPSQKITEEECEQIIDYALEGIKQSPNKSNKYIDLDIDTSQAIFNRISHKIKTIGAKLIVSYHNFSSTPQPNYLEEKVKYLFKKGDIAKIATMANSTQDSVNIINLYKKFPPQRLLAFCMGQHGKFTRRLAVELGSPWSYTSLSNDSSTAPGQFTFEELTQISSANNFPFKIDFSQIKQVVQAPASKSHLQRVIVAACLCKGDTIIHNYTNCNDSEAAIALFSYLGVKFDLSEETGISNEKLVITSKGVEGLLYFIDSFPNNRIFFNTGESGLLTRLMIPVAAMLLQKSQKSIVITGSGTILNREFAESKEVLTQLGYNVKHNNNKLPLEISRDNSLKVNRNITISGREGSQLISGLLMSLPLLPHNYTLKIENPSSTPYIDTTITTLKEFGIESVNLQYIEYKTTGGKFYKTPNNIKIDGDWSSASALLVAGAIKNGVIIKNLQLNSGQADEKIFDVLKSCGANISYNSSENSVIVQKNQNNLKGFDFDATDSPDLFPALTVLAVNCDGVSKIKGVSRLFNKESNRAEALYSEFIKLGAHIQIEDNTLIIRGSKLHENRCYSYHDHRIAMALISASLNIKEPIYLDNISCIGKSFPYFINCFI